MAMGAILNNSLISQFNKNKPANLPKVFSNKYETIKNSLTTSSGSFTTNVSAPKNLPSYLIKYVNEITSSVYKSLTSSIGNILLFSAIVIVISIIFVFFIKEIPLRTTDTHTIVE